MAESVLTTTHFLKRDELYETEKPYSLRFTPPEGVPRANIKLERHDIDIHDMRNVRTLSFSEDGVAILQMESKMTYANYDIDTVVKDVFLKEVADLLKAFLGAQHVQIFEHTVRRESLVMNRYKLNTLFQGSKAA